MTALWTAPAPLLLASTSAARRQLLEGTGLPFDLKRSGVDERAVEEAARSQALSPPSLARRLAVEKALAVSARHPDRIVVGADQVLACEGQVFHKPDDRKAARAHLQALAGRTHELHSAVAIAIGGQEVEDFVATARLTMRALTETTIDLYLDLISPDALHGAGVYQVESLGIHLFDAIEGDHSTILGLPLIPLLSTLRRLGCLAL